MCQKVSHVYGMVFFARECELAMEYGKSDECQTMGIEHFELLSEKEGTRRVDGKQDE